MNDILAAQLADDFCCTPAEVMSRENIFTVYSPREGRRRFQEKPPCPLKIASVHGKLLVTGREDLVRACQAQHREANAAWFMEPETLRALDAMLSQHGLCIGMAHPFFIAARRVSVRTDGLDIRWYDEAAIRSFEGCGRYGEAYAFCPDAPDVLGVSAACDGEILAMAGASRDSARMYQIGIDVEEKARGRGLAVTLVALLSAALMDRGILPFYGTSMSHIASQRVAVRAGFEPAWAELCARPVPPHQSA